MTGEVRYDPRPGTVPEQNTVIASEPNRVAPGCRIEGPTFLNSEWRRCHPLSHLERLTTYDHLLYLDMRSH